MPNPKIKCFNFSCSSDYNTILDHFGFKIVNCYKTQSVNVKYPKVLTRQCKYVIIKKSLKKTNYAWGNIEFVRDAQI